MRTLLLISLIISLIIYFLKIIMWIKTVIFIAKNNDEVISAIKDIKQTKFTNIFGGIEHLIIFSTLLACLIIIF